MLGHFCVSMLVIQQLRFVHTVLFGDHARAHAHQDILLKLQLHILLRILETLGKSHDTNSVDSNTIILKNDWMYWDNIMHVNYMTYDV